jgi:hypothetical protein
LPGKLFPGHVQIKRSLADHLEQSHQIAEI